VNQLKAILARFGIRTFRPILRRAEEKLDALQATGMISWPALNQIVCALRFFFGVTLGQATIPERIAYAREPQKLPVVLSPDEVVRFLEASPSRRASMAYGGMNAWDFVADARTTRVRMGRLRRNWHGMTQLPARALKNEWPTGQGSRRQRGAEPRVR
jgi:integrase